MKDSVKNPLITYQGIEIYGSDIDIVTAEYLEKLSNPEMIYTKSAVFNGLMHSIYTKLLKPLVYNPDVLRQSYDYKLLDNIFQSVYLPLCYGFNKTPTVISFAVLVDVDYEHLISVKNGYYPGGEKVNITHSKLVRKWFTTCESGLVNKTVDENGIGSMFLLKAKYGYRDNQTLTIESGSKMVHETAAEIAQRYANARLPEKPEL